MAKTSAVRSPNPTPAAGSNLAIAGLAAMLASGKLDMRAYYRACVLSGVPFAAATRRAHDLAAWRRAYPEPSRAMALAYRDYVRFEL